WHHLCLQVGGGQIQRGVLVVCPDHLELPDYLQSGSLWGVAVQLYSVCSRQSWGLGDLVDLAQLGYCLASHHRAGFILINPIHAAEPLPPLTRSPYLPVTRDFINPIYIRPEATWEYQHAPKVVKVQVDQLAKAAAAHAAQLDQLDRDHSWTLKRQALGLLFDLPAEPTRDDQLAQFQADWSPGIGQFALWNALTEAGLADQVAMGSAAAVQFSQQNARQVSFHVWLQLLASEQLAAAQAACLQGGMKIGLIKDLAVGVHPEGADAWSNGQLLAKKIATGAPPDYFNQVGQNWTEPPWRPDVLEALGYQPWRTMLRAVFANAGALRIDHILGLFRLWWIPQGMKPSDGTYVAYNHEAMVSILVLEAYRANALVVGEDLGVVPKGVPQYLASRGVLGTSVAWFERAKDGSGKKPPADYRRLALTMLTTHDLPPTLAYLQGDHVVQRHQLGMLDVPLAQAQALAAEDRRTMVQLLEKLHFLDGSQRKNNQAIVLAMHRLLKATDSVLIGVALTDMVGERRSQNLPGTDTQYPNWSVPLRNSAGQQVFLEDLVANPTFQAIAGIMAEIK
ncbi:MAG: 4-alpha-glucanotransferase, partial [Micrococcales bacterium]|nr:4-alpha-glucanotransferase [Micrococcales bacterium]